MRWRLKLKVMDFLLLLSFDTSLLVFLSSIITYCHVVWREVFFYAAVCVLSCETCMWSLNDLRLMYTSWVRCGRVWWEAGWFWCYMILRHCFEFKCVCSVPRYAVCRNQCMVWYGLVSLLNLRSTWLMVEEKWMRTWTASAWYPWFSTLMYVGRWSFYTVIYIYIYIYSDVMRCVPLKPWGCHEHHLYVRA